MITKSFILVGQFVRGYLGAWAECFGCFFTIHILAGMVLGLILLVGYDIRMSRPATSEHFASLQKEAGTCAPHTMKIRIEESRKNDRAYVVTRRDVDRTIKDCREMYSSQDVQAREDAIMKNL